MPMSFGLALKQAREVKNLDLSTIARAINVQEKYLQALEEERVRDIPSLTYGKYFLRRYAAYLGVSAAALENSLVNAHRFLEQHNLVVRPKKGKHKTFSLRSHTLLIRRFSIVAVITLCGIGYLSFSLAQSLQPPQLRITSPAQNLITHATELRVSGSTDSEAQVTVNDQNVAIDEEGNFSFQLSIQPGAQIIRVHAVKKHGLASEEERQILALE